MVSRSQQDTAPGLLQLRAEQQRFDVGGITVGGQAGVRPTVLIGSIFYHGQDIIIDEERGDFWHSEAEELIRIQETYSERTGNPCMLDVAGATPEAIRRHLAFAAEVTEMPLLVSGTTAEVRLEGLRYVSEAGLAGRAVYNAIQPGTSDDELRAVRQAGIESAVILTYCLQDFTAKGRVTAVRDLVPRVRAAGVEKLMIDTCVVDLASLGQALSALFDIKDEMGLPAGGGVHNAVAVWRDLESSMGEHAYYACVATAVASAVAIGADFALYGPIEGAKYVFPAVALLDTALSQFVTERGIRPDENHPRYRIGA